MVACKAAAARRLGYLMLCLLSVAQDWLEHETILQLAALHGEVDAVTQLHLQRTWRCSQQCLGPGLLQIWGEHSFSHSEGMELARSFG